MDFSLFDEFFNFISEVTNLTMMVAEAFSFLPRIFISYWVVFILGVIFIGLIRFIVRLVS